MPATAAAAVVLYSIASLVVLPTCTHAKVNKIQLNLTSKAYYKEVGELSSGQHYAHLYSLVDGDEAVKQYNRIVEALDSVQLTSLTHSKGTAGDSIINSTFDEFQLKMRTSRERLSWICVEIKCQEKFVNGQFAMQLRPEPKRVTFAELWHGFREKREGIGDAFSFAAFGLSLYSISEVKRLHRELQTEGNVVQHVAAELGRESHQIQENADQIQSIRNQVSLLTNFTTRSQFRMDRAAAISYIEVFTSNLDAYSAGLENMLLRKSASLQFFELEAVKTAIGKIQKRARSNGLKLKSASPTELFQERLSWVAYEGKIGLYFHLPLMEKKTLNLYQYLPTPFQLPNSTFMRPEIEGEFFAVSEKYDRFMIFSRAEIADCNQWGKVFSCPTRVEFKDPKETCLGSIFAGDPQFILHFCKFAPWPIKGELVLQVDTFKVMTIVVPGHQVTAYISCYLSNSNRRSPMSNLLLAGTEEVELDPGCLMTTDRFRIMTAREHEITEYIFARPISEFITTFQRDSFHSQGVENILPTKFHRIAPHLITVPSQMNDGNNWVWLGILYVLFVIIFAVAVGFACRHRILHCLLECLRRRHLTGEPAQLLGQLLGERHGADRPAPQSLRGEAGQEAGEDPRDLVSQPVGAVPTPNMDIDRANNCNEQEGSESSGSRVATRSRATSADATWPTSSGSDEPLDSSDGSSHVEGDLPGGDGSEGEGEGSRRVPRLIIPPLISNEPFAVYPGAILSRRGNQADAGGGQGTRAAQ